MYCSLIQLQLIAAYFLNRASNPEPVLTPSRKKYLQYHQIQGSGNQGAFGHIRFR